MNRGIPPCPPAERLPPETKAENGTAVPTTESTFCTDALLFPRPRFFSCAPRVIATISLPPLSPRVINAVKRKRKEKNRRHNSPSMRIVVVDEQRGKRAKGKGRLASRLQKKEKKKEKGETRCRVLERMRSTIAISFFLPGTLDISDGLPAATKLPSADSRVITSDIERKAARTRSDEHRNLAQWPLGSAPH